MRSLTEDVQLSQEGENYTSPYLRTPPVASSKSSSLQQYDIDGYSDCEQINADAYFEASYEFSAERHGAVSVIRYCMWPKPAAEETQVIEVPCCYVPVPELKNEELPPKHVVYAQPKFFYRGIGFCSLSEAVLGVLLERFIEGFKVVSAATFQVPIGGGRSVDFRIGEYFIEFHPIRLQKDSRRCGDFGSYREYKEYMRKLKKIGKRRHYDRKQFVADTCKKLSQKYYSKRRRVIPQGYNLIVATTLREFYDRVVLKFATCPPPSFELFETLFNTEVKIIGNSIR
jgi:hypothetical protein